MAATMVAVAVWGTSSVLVKTVEGGSIIGIAFHRLWIGAALTAAAFVLSGRRITLRLLRLCLGGGIAFAADIVLFFGALTETSVTNATVIGALQPVLVLALARRLFGERPGLAEAFWAAVAIAGTVIVVAGSGGGGVATRWGDLLAVGALVAWTWYFVASKRARTELPTFDYLTGLSIVAALAVLPVALLSGAGLALARPADWAVVVVIALVNGAFGHFLLNWAHAHVTLVVISVLTLGIPVIAAAAAAVFIDEPVSMAQAVGMAVAIGALTVVVVRTSRPAVIAPPATPPAA